MARSFEHKRTSASSPVVTNYATRNGSGVLIFGFVFIIFLGTVLLRLPQATSGDSITWFEALFTATSAATVTGLTLFPTAETFSLFGEIVILALIQIGGIGFITLSVFLLRLIGRNISLGEKRLLRSFLGATKIKGSVKQLTVAVVTVVFGIEILGAIPLYLGWKNILGAGKAAYYAIFHSISSFANAGFDLFAGTSDPLVIATRANTISVLTMAILITLGTMGIAATFDLINWPRRRRFSLHTKLILPLMLVLTIIGTGVFVSEQILSGEAMTFENILTSFFTVISSRTAGITLVDMADYGPGSQVVVSVMMFVGGAPASMGGGVGLTTIAVMLLALYDASRGNSDVRAYGRTIPTETIYKALAILGMSTILVFAVSVAVVTIEGSTTFPLLFEVASAFSNTGYSLGVTPTLHRISQALLVGIMFIGRLGPLTLVVALAEKARQSQIKYPKESIIIG